MPILTRTRLASAFFLLATLAVGSFADTIRLKDGSIIKGRITTFGGGKFVVVVGEGARRKSMSFGAGEIDSIEFDGSSIAAASRPASTMSQASYDPRPAQAKPSSRVVIHDETRAVPASVAIEPSVPETAPIKIKPSVSSTQPQNASGARSPASSNVKPIEVSVKVAADNTKNGWTNSGWVVKRGQHIKITAEGEVSLGGGKASTPSGLYDLEDPGKLLPNVPTGALLAVIGDDNNEFIYIGSSREFTASRDGALFLGLNEANLNDNSGAYNATVEIDPASDR